ncbi:MAG: ATP synthase F1 subunit gamma [Candidatus Levybacteria bacterium]|nr:ATP synthase F1 subunit gamma [Candidatus Levybacteria bacterium]
MATILTLKRRIKAAQNVSKTTKAMQMIAVSKMKRAQEAVLASRPYVQKLISLSSKLSRTVEKEEKHPYLQSKMATNRTLIIVLSPDKGLCGGLITNLLREFLRLSKEEKEASYITVGKKLEGQVAHRKNEVIASFTFGSTTPTMEMVYPIIRIIDEYYIGEKVDGVKVLGAHFTSLFSQTPKVTTILPITVMEDLEKDQQYLFEPKLDTLLPPLLKHYLEMTIFQLLLENFVSEQASRMLAMQNATDNANGIIEDLKLEYNKTRQAKITSEILDITSASIGATQ